MNRERDHATFPHGDRIGSCRGRTNVRATSGRAWVLLVFALILLNIGVCAVTVMAAVMSSRTATTEADYYQKALDWDRVQAVRRASDALGWLLHVEAVAPNSGAGRWLIAEATDREGRPLSGARMNGEVFHRADPGSRALVEFDEVSAGLYRTFVPIERHGIWEVRLRTTRAQATHVHTTTMVVLPRDLTNSTGSLGGVEP
jgi:hypothetical protein